VQVVDLSSNQFSGSVEDDFTPASVLEELNLESNAFSGMIPPSLANVSSLTSLRLQHNSFTGPVPLEICNLREVTDGGYRAGLLQLEADCLTTRFGRYNSCSCCTSCCSRRRDTCQAEDNNLIPGAEANDVCVESLRWDRSTGVIVE